MTNINNKIKQFSKNKGKFQKKMLNALCEDTSTFCYSQQGDISDHKINKQTNKQIELSTGILSQLKIK